ncbi:hypothetical protein FL734_02875 [Salmonella enterica]|nr:hypothetical protein [Salmonella enterica]ECJ5538123.1 hypothetical protein [Salmonella enterica]ECL1405892.1 hypothetical protein [Salmonella enterica]EDR6096209.1 hypothetical protein [Salmonella enterica subsp. enterica serovar Java]
MPHRLSATIAYNNRGRGASCRIVLPTAPQNSATAGLSVDLTAVTRRNVIRLAKVVPDSFTHGTSEQRYSWFKRGFDSGDPAQCNTFGKNF